MTESYWTQQKRMLKGKLHLLFATFTFVGIAFFCYNAYEVYNVATNWFQVPYPWGNTWENSWFYKSPGVYIAYCCGNVVLYGIGAALLLIGNSNEHTRLMWAGTIFCFITLALNLAFGQYQPI